MNNLTVRIVTLDGEEGDSKNNGNDQADETADSDNKRIDEEETSTAGCAETNNRENNENYTKDNSYANVGGQLLDDRRNILAKAQINRGSGHEETDEEQNNVHANKATVLLIAIFRHCHKLRNFLRMNRKDIYFTAESKCPFYTTNVNSIPRRKTIQCNCTL